MLDATHTLHIVSRLRSKINEEAENLRKGLNEIADAVKGARHIDTQNAVFRVEDIVTRIGRVIS